MNRLCCRVVGTAYLAKDCSKPPLSRNFSGRFSLKEKFKQRRRRENMDFVEWQQQLREDLRNKSAQKGLEKFDDSKFSNQLIFSDGDKESARDKKVEALKAAIHLYKDRQPRLKQDHPQFVQWCVLRMYEYDLADEVEFYELLFECFPPHMYHTEGVIDRWFPKRSPGFLAAVDLILVGQQRKVKPTYTLYRNVVRAFGFKHELCSMVRRWAWLHYVFRNANPYPLSDGSYDFKSLAADHQQMAEYVAERTMDQKCSFREVKNSLGDYLGTSVISRTQQDLSILQTPDDTMRLTGPHSIWVGREQRWYWVLRREERGDEFEGAPLGILVSPYKETSREGAQIWLQECREQYKGIGGSTILIDEPDELLQINPEEHFKERVSLFSDGIEDVYVDSSILPDLVDEKKKEAVKKLGKSKEIKFIRDRDSKDKDDEW